MPKTTDDYANFMKQVTFNYNKDELIKEASTFFNTTKLYQESEFVPFNNIGDLINTSFFVGEIHGQTASKKFLQGNFKLLADAGYKKFYVEGLNYARQHEIDHCDLDNKDDIIRKRLVQLCQAQEHQCINSKAWELRENNYMTMFTAAREAGLRVIGIDSHSLSNKPGIFLSEPDRVATMNYLSYQIIMREEQESPSKWCAFVGYGHLKTIFGFPGLNELTGARAVRTFDNDYTEVNFYNNMHDSNVGYVQVDIKRKKLTPLIQQQTMSLDQVERSIKNYHNNNYSVVKSWSNFWHSTDQHAEKLKMAQSDEIRLATATAYLRDNSNSAYATELRDVLWKPRI